MLSFDITDRNIRIIRGAESNGKIKISSAATLNLNEDLIVNGHAKDIPGLATKINQCLKTNRMFDKEAIVSISSNLTIFKELVLPKLKETDFVKSVKAEMQAAMGIDDTYSISYTIVGETGESDFDKKGGSSGGSGNKLRILATACPYEIIDCYKKVFSMLSIGLKSIMVGCNCITKVLLSDDRIISKMPLLAVQIDNNFLSLNLYEKGQLSFSRFASIDASDYDNSADYVYEAVNENIFRMMQFQKSRNSQEPIRNVVFYGDTKEYVRLTRDLEQMDINTSVITVPKNVSGYQNLEFSVYANAIGAMFKRNKETEKVNFLDFAGGGGSAINTKIQSDNAYYVVLGIATVGTLLIMGGIFVFGFFIPNKSLEKDIKDANAYIKSPKTIALLEKRDARELLAKKIEGYRDRALIANNALKSKPYISSELITNMENTIKNAAGELGASEDKVLIKNVTYIEEGINVLVEAPAGEDMAPKLPAYIVQKLKETNYFYDVEYKNYDVFESEEDGQAKERKFSYNLILKVKGEDLADEVLSNLLEISEATKAGGKKK